MFLAGGGADAWGPGSAAAMADLGRAAALPALANRPGRPAAQRL